MKYPILCFLFLMLVSKASCFTPTTITKLKTIPTDLSSLSSSSTNPPNTSQIRKDINLYAFWDRLVESKFTVRSNNDVGDETKTKIPFVIDRIARPTKEECEEISSLIIKVFFEEEAERKPLSALTSEDGGSTPSMTPWKALQLAYLRNMQNGDMRSRVFDRRNTKSDMFVARRVVLSTSTPIDSEQKVDISEVFNTKSLPKERGDSAYIRGDVIGFVDISEKNFGLASEFDLTDDYTNDIDETENDLEGIDNNIGESMPVRRKSKSTRPLRPVLTNLAVSEDCRGSNVGSKLVEACENAVLNLWGDDFGKYEIILEVQEENEIAQRFYEKRGYDALFADPSTRRYDASGLFLKTVRTTKICYRKDLRMKRAKQKGIGAKGNSEDFFGSNMFQMIRDTVRMTSR